MRVRLRADKHRHAVSDGSHQYLITLEHAASNSYAADIKSRNVAAASTAPTPSAMHTAH
ncbi:hypothetical protein PR003_g13898 [Phytophthora rubi]|uniref:Uncharacterized protein n=1 Tax=Phytophthora rubi TaxID=129364 RepID=A0A6A4F5I6_9STRA|nr:hypothetical protein PR003_g13898 [Phytophthora rubi]